MIFETYIFEYFKVRIFDSHLLGLLCVSLVNVLLFFIKEGERFIQTFSKYCTIRNIENKHITTILPNKRERKHKTEEFLLY